MNKILFQLSTLNNTEIEAIKEGKKLPLAEHLLTIQGEGYHTGKPAYFIRLAGCDIGCSWCDTKYTWDMASHPLVEADRIALWAIESGIKDVVITGGEPLMHNLNYLTARLKENNLTIYLETSGAHPMRGIFDWISLSPKINKPPLPEALQRADELKVIILTTEDFAWAEKNAGLVRPGCILFLQPEWNRYRQIIPDIIEYVKKNPKWRISLQTHKFMHIS